MQNRSFEKLLSEITEMESPVIVFSRVKRNPGRVTSARESKPGAANEKALRKRILLVGSHRELALYRAEVLHHAGFRVRAPESKQQAMAMIERGDFDVAVLSYTLSNSTVQELADNIREHCPHCPVVAIAETNRHDRRIAPDAIAVAADGPSGLVSALQKVLEQR